jgi:hypothetical protein
MTSKPILTEPQWVAIAVSRGLPERAGFYAWTVAEATTQQEGYDFLEFCRRMRE